MQMSFSPLVSFQELNMNAIILPTISFQLINPFAGSHFFTCLYPPSSILHGLYLRYNMHIHGGTEKKLSQTAVPNLHTQYEL